MEQEIQVFQLTRMFLGDEPPLFLLEVALRTTIIYLYALLLLRWLGSRTIGQLSTIEFLLVIALGSAVGDAMFYPDVPLLHALLVITLVVIANKALDILIAKSRAAEMAVDGIPEEAVREGTICREFLEKNSLSANELFQQLREQGIEHLGQVAHAYVETDGVVTVFRSNGSKPGLPIMPPWEIEPAADVPLGKGRSFTPAACKRCGWIAVADVDLHKCPNCGHGEWVRARDSEASL